MCVKCSIYKLGFLVRHSLLPIDFVRERGQCSLDNLTCNVDTNFVSKLFKKVAAVNLKPSASPRILLHCRENKLNLLKYAQSVVETIVLRNRLILKHNGSNGDSQLSQQ
jgi:hypothetical protein